MTLSNNSTSRSGESLDTAINAINTALQQSNNSALKQIVAVKDNSSGTEQIRFLSQLNSFQVTIGTTPQRDGIGSQGTTATSSRSAGGSTADITSQASAEAAVTALSKAVPVLGSSQAVVGRGENQFNYAINLANSQLTNFPSCGIHDPRCGPGHRIGQLDQGANLAPSRRRGVGPSQLGASASIVAAQRLSLSFLLNTDPRGRGAMPRPRGFFVLESDLASVREFCIRYDLSHPARAKRFVSGHVFQPCRQARVKTKALAPAPTSSAVPTAPPP